MRIRRCALTAAITTLTVSPLLSSAPAAAHSGGRAQLYVDSVRLEPRPDGWRAEVVVRDADSGRPEPGFGVQVTASTADGRTVGPTTLNDPDADGRYEALLALTEGPWTLTAEADEIPGGARAIPFRKTWPVALQAGHPVDVAGSRPPTGDHRSGSRAVPLILGGTAAAAALSALLTLARTRSAERLAHKVCR
jgi:hypothetical protein